MGRVRLDVRVTVTNTSESRVGCAKNYLHSALVAGANVAVGGGHGPVNHLFNPNKLKTI